MLDRKFGVYFYTRFQLLSKRASSRAYLLHIIGSNSDINLIRRIEIIVLKRYCERKKHDTFTCFWSKSRSAYTFTPIGMTVWVIDKWLVQTNHQWEVHSGCDSNEKFSRRCVVWMSEVVKSTKENVQIQKFENGSYIQSFTAKLKTACPTLLCSGFLIDIPKRFSKTSKSVHNHFNLLISFRCCGELTEWIQLSISPWFSNWLVNNR